MNPSADLEMSNVGQVGHEMLPKSSFMLRLKRGDYKNIAHY